MFIGINISQLAEKKKGVPFLILLDSDCHLGTQVPVQVHRRDPYKRKRSKMLVWVHALDLYEHPFARKLNAGIVT